MKSLSLTEKRDVLDAAEAHCQALGVRLTRIRRQVLELVLEYPDVVKAYDLLEDLKRIRRNAAPPTVYRALEFLVEIGILHRIKSLNAFVFCPQFRHPHVSVIINCTRCGHTREIAAEKPLSYLIEFCEENGFNPTREPMILTGLCSECKKEIQ